MSEELPPTIDPIAAARWHARASASSPWLHEEVARRMQERLQWMAEPPQRWCDWDPLRGGLQGHALIAERFARAQCVVNETSGAPGQTLARQHLAPPWWSAARWRAPALAFGAPEEASVQMLWSNMALHMAANPQALIAQWQRAVSVNGYLMFSCFGPDTLRELRAVYSGLGWPEPVHTLTDMHDWGDMLLRAGFAEPVMDMERIVLTFATPGRLLQELRGLGRNLHTERFAALRGRRWRARLEQALAEQLADPQHGGQLALTFEVIYGHAFKPAPRAPLSITKSRP